MNNKIKILLFDIETSPVLAWIWRTGHKINIDHKQIKAGQKFDIICICYKWAHENTIHSLDWGLNKQNSAVMVEEFSKVVAQAHVVIAHNGDAFDIKQINTQRLLHNQDPINWPTSEDTLKQLRKHFFFPAYNLDYIARTLTGSGKARMEFQDWIDIVESKKAKALAKMIRYGKRDVRKLYLVWKRCAKYCTAKVHAGLISGQLGISCPRCAHPRFVNDGFKDLSTGKYQRYQCSKCGHKWRDSKRIR